jgi:phenylpropionate dioxygenase-like ring-hydroxylating dioxygenase large terminal subunit
MMNENKSLPYNLYVDPKVLELEQGKIFKRSWNFVGHVSRIQNPGDFFTCQVAGEPILVVRD